MIKCLSAHFEIKKKRKKEKRFIWASFFFSLSVFPLPSLLPISFSLEKSPTSYKSTT